MLIFNQRNHSCYYNQALILFNMRPISINPRCTCRNVKPDVVIQNKKSTAKADATEIIDVETFQLSSPIATTTSVVINLSDIEDDDDDDVRILNFVPKNTSFEKRKRIKLEKGESSKQNSNPNDVPFFFEICTETITAKKLFSSPVVIMLIALIASFFTFVKKSKKI